MGCLPVESLHGGRSSHRRIQTNKYWRHWYYRLLRRQPENNSVITQRVNDIGSTEWTKFYYDRGNYGGIAAFEPYTKMLTNFIAVANAENVLKNLNTSNWNSNTCYFKGEEGFN